MKYKLTDGFTITLAGVAAYDTSNHTHDEGRKTRETIDISFDLPHDFNFDKQALKDEVNRFKEEAKRIKVEAKKIHHNFHDQAKQTKNQTEQETQGQKETPNNGSSQESRHDYGFGKVMEDWGENFGKNMETWGKAFEKNMESWTQGLDQGLSGLGKTMESFGKSVENWGENFGKNMESWGENFGKKAESWGKNFEQYVHDFEKHWDSDYNYDRYENWELESLFLELYQQNDKIKEMDKTPNIFFQLNLYDLNTSMNNQLTFIGCQVDEKNRIPYTFVSQQVRADKWLLVKLSAEEFQKDWMSKISELDQVQGYDIDPYLVVRHFKDPAKQESKKVKLYIPLMAQ